MENRVIIKKREFLVQALPPAAGSFVVWPQSKSDLSGWRKEGDSFSYYVKKPAIYFLEIKGEDEYLQEKNLRLALRLLLAKAAEKKAKELAISDLDCENLALGCKNTAKIIAQEIYKQLLTNSLASLQKIVLFSFKKNICKIFSDHILSYLSYMEFKMSQGPFLTVDVIVEYKGGIVLVKRRNPPLGWALPGGFVDYGETAEEAAKREVKEETGLEISRVLQFGLYSDPKRDDRFHTASLVFSAKAKGRLQSGSDAAAARVFSCCSLPLPLAFDHEKIITEWRLARARICPK